MSALFRQIFRNKVDRNLSVGTHENLGETVTQNPHRAAVASGVSCRHDGQGVHVLKSQQLEELRTRNEEITAELVEVERIRQEVDFDLKKWERKVGEVRASNLLTPQEKKDSIAAFVPAISILKSQAVQAILRIQRLKKEQETLRTELKDYQHTSKDVRSISVAA